MCDRVDIWDLKFSFGLNACRDKFDPGQSKSDGRAYFEIRDNEKPDVLIVLTSEGEQLTFNVKISK